MNENFWDQVPLKQKLWKLKLQAYIRNVIVRIISSGPPVKLFMSSALRYRNGK